MAPSGLNSEVLLKAMLAMGRCHLSTPQSWGGLPWPGTLMPACSKHCSDASKQHAGSPPALNAPATHAQPQILHSKP